MTICTHMKDADWLGPVTCNRPAEHVNTGSDHIAVAVYQGARVVVSWTDRHPGAVDIRITAAGAAQ